MIMLLSSISYSQSSTYRTEGLDQTDTITQGLLGTWEHIVSVYPNDSTATYWYEHTFYADSTARSRKIRDGDIVDMYTIWFVVDTTVYLYTQVDTTLVLSDVVAVVYMHDNMFSVTKVVGEVNRRKTAVYARKEY